jgi:hypothetical protein
MVSVAVPRGDEIQPLTARGKMMHLIKTTLLCVALAASAVTAFNAYGGSSSTRRAFVSESTAAAAAIVALPRAGVQYLRQDKMSRCASFVLLVS